MIPFQITDWEQIPKTEHAGETGTAYWQTLLFDSIRIRMVEYSPGYSADHWCEKGHIIYCIEGEMTTTLKDGSRHVLKQGMSYKTTDNPRNPHSSLSAGGCKLFIVDGGFLKP
ncbi:MAG: DHCW motif cupin fold protein [Bacteroidia bacterium]